jgi:hypothetical protein
LYCTPQQQLQSRIKTNLKNWCRRSLMCASRRIPETRVQLWGQSEATRSHCVSNHSSVLYIHTHWASPSGTHWLHIQWYNEWGDWCIYPCFP